MEGEEKTCSSTEKPMSKLKCKLLRLAFYSDLHGIRIVLAIAEFIWAASFMIPGDTVDRPIYEVMKKVLPEDEYWAMVWIVLAVVQFYIVCTGRYHDRFAVWFAAGSSIVWWFVTCSMYFSVYPPSANTSGDLALAMASTFVWVRSGWIAAGARRCHVDLAI